MKKIESLQHFETVIQSNENVWLLLYKKGSELSDCAFENFKQAENSAGEKANNKVLCAADVNEVRDIHPEFGVTSAPALLYFEKGKRQNLVKGCHRPEQFNAIFAKTAVVLSRSGKNKTQKNVTVFTTPTCTWCNTIKRHLQEHGVRYREVDISRDQKAAEEMVKRSGRQGVPQTDINGKIIVGFDKTRINTLLEIN